MAKHPTTEQILAMPLREQAFALADAQYRHRLQELNSTAAAFSLLEREIPALTAAGYTIRGSDVHATFGQRLTLTFSSSAFFESDAKRYRALARTGFKEIERAGPPAWPTVTFQKGRLRLRIPLRGDQLPKVDTEGVNAAEVPA